MTRIRIPLPMVGATASGTTAFSSYIHQGGHLEAIRLVRPATNQLATTVKLTITGDESGIELFNATATSTGSQTWYPRTPIVDTSAVQPGYTSGATPPPIYTRLYVGGNERIRVVVASGGTTAASGVLHIYLAGA